VGKDARLSLISETRREKDSLSEPKRKDVCFLRVYENAIAVASHKLSGRNNSINNAAGSGVENPGERNPENENTSLADYLISEDIRTGQHDLSATSRAQEHVSYVQAAGDALQAASDILHSMREVAVQSAYSTDSAAEREILDLAFTQKKFALDTLGSLRFYGVNYDISEPNDFGFTSMDAGYVASSVEMLDLGSLGSVETTVAARDAIGAIDNALAEVSASQAELDEAQSHIAGTVRQSQSAERGQPQTEESRVSDADIAQSVNATVQRMLSSPSAAVSAQAHVMPQTVINLLGG